MQKAPAPPTVDKRTINRDLYDVVLDSKQLHRALAEYAAKHTLTDLSSDNVSVVVSWQGLEDYIDVADLKAVVTITDDHVGKPAAA